jgi:hypothetical protein
MSSLIKSIVNEVDNTREQMFRILESYAAVEIAAKHPHKAKKEQKSKNTSSGSSKAKAEDKSDKTSKDTKKE